LASLLILGAGAASGSGALHRPVSSRSPTHSKNSSGLALAIANRPIQIRRVAAALVQRQISIHLHHIAGEYRAQPPGQIALVGLAGGDVVPDTGDVLRISRPCPSRLPRTGGVCPGRTARGGDRWHWCGLVAQPEPHQRRILLRACPGVSGAHRAASRPADPGCSRHLRRWILLATAEEAVGQEDF